VSATEWTIALSGCLFGPGIGIMVGLALGRVDWRGRIAELEGQLDIAREALQHQSGQRGTPEDGDAL
jgi:hypothetical protein